MLGFDLGRRHTPKHAASIVDQAIQSTKYAGGFPDHFRRCTGYTHIALNRKDMLGKLCLKGKGCFTAFIVMKGNLGTLCGKPPDNLGPDPG